MRNSVTTFMKGASVRCHEPGNEPTCYIKRDELVVKLVTKSVSTIRLFHAVNFVLAFTKSVSNFAERSHIQTL